MKPRGRDRQLTTREAAAYCQVSVPTLKRWIAEGALRVVRTPGGHSRIEREHFQQFLRDHGMPAYPNAEPETRILVVDDEPEIVSVLVNLLLADPRPFKIETASDGYEALVKVGAFKPALLILDILMPGLDGVQVCRRLKEVPESSAVKILGTTAYDDRVEAFLAAGADACLVKPLDVTAFQRTVHFLLDDRTTS